MKLFISIFFIIAGIQINASNFIKENNSSKPIISLKVRFVGEIGLKSEDCRKIGLGCLGAEITIGINASDDTPRKANEVIIQSNDDRTLTFTFMEVPDMTDNFLILDKDYILSAELQKALKINNGIIPSGKYKIDWRRNGLIQVTLPLK